MSHYNKDMARPLRLEYAGALYHVTARGDRQQRIFRDKPDRQTHLSVLGDVCSRFNWIVHAYCQMTNHYHLIVETPDGNLSKGMRQLNGVYTQRFNRRHGVIGHLFQGRYKAILVQKETYLLALSGYVVLNPVRAGIVKDPKEWEWSSYRATVGDAKTPAWLDGDWLLSQFDSDRSRAITAYRRFVKNGMGMPSPWKEIKHQILLGDEKFAAVLADGQLPQQLREVSKAQRRSLALPLMEYRKRYKQRDEAMARAYASGAYTMAQIGEFFGVHYMTVSRAVRRFEKSNPG